MALFRCARCHAVYADYYPTDDTCIKCNKGHIRIITPQGGKTMTAIKPTIKLFTSQEDDCNGIHINSLILEHNGNNYQFHGGSNDTIHVFVQSIALYVLTINETNGTMGLQSFMVPEPDPINSVYLHTLTKIVNVFGVNWNDVSHEAIVAELIDRLM
jgi:hypothetical protein